MLEEPEHAREAAFPELRAKLRRGIEQADRGELFDGDGVLDEIRQLSKQGRVKTRNSSVGLHLRRNDHEAKRRERPPAFGPPTVLFRYSCIGLARWQA